MLLRWVDSGKKIWSLAVIIHTLLVVKSFQYGLHSFSFSPRTGKKIRSNLRLSEINDDDEECFFSPDQPQMIECELPVPNPEMTSDEVISMCVGGLQSNSEPYPNAGLEINFNFSSDRCRAIQGGSLSNFIEFANNPTFGSMINAKSWRVLSVGPVIRGTQTRGDMQTFLVNIVPASGNKRQFVWTLQKERRPPRSGCWLVHEVLYRDHAFSTTL